MAKHLTRKIESQIQKAGLPRAGEYPYVPKLEKKKKGRPTMRRMQSCTAQRPGNWATSIHLAGFRSKTGRTRAIPITGMYKKTAAARTFESIWTVIS